MSRKAEIMYEYDEEEPYIPPTPKRRATAGQDYTFSERKTEAQPRQQAPPKNHHYLFWVGIGMLVCLGIWMGITLVVVPWWNGMQLQWHYGDPPRVTELQADVSHGRMSRYTKFDNNGQVAVLHLVNGKVGEHTGGSFVGDDKNKRIINLSIADINHDGKPDLVIHVVGMDGEMVLVNTGSAFSWTNH